MTTPRWYMVNKMGMATLCTDREDAEQEAKDANMAWPHTAPHRAVQLVEVGTAAAELRRQHAHIAELEARVQELGAMARENRSRRIVELEAQLEAVGAGGVSGPLMGKPQEMPDLSALTERGAKAWAGVDAQGLRGGGADISKEREDFNAWLRTYEEEVGAIDEAAAWAGFSGAHASLAASAGSEPVATVFTMDALAPGGGVKYHATVHKPLPAGTKLYLHPSPPEGMVGGWTALPGALPEPGVPVLLDIGKKYPIRAMWTPAKTLEASNDSDDVGDYDEATDAYYCPEGWYEWNEHEEIHWAVTETPRAWAPLPPTTPAGSGKGD